MHPIRKNKQTTFEHIANVNSKPVNGHALSFMDAHCPTQPQRDLFARRKKYRGAVVAGSGNLWGRVWRSARHITKENESFRQFSKSTAHLFFAPCVRDHQNVLLAEATLSVRRVKPHNRELNMSAEVKHGSVSIKFVGDSNDTNPVEFDPRLRAKIGA